MATPLVPDFSFCRQDVIVHSLTMPGDIAGSQQFLFSKKLAVPVNLALAADVKPYVLSFSARPTKIEQDKALTQRSRVTVRYADDDNAPDFDTAVFTTFKDFSFWRRLVVAQPDYIGAAYEIRRGRLEDGVVTGGFAGMRTIFKGRLESIDFAEDGTVSLVAKDQLALQDRLTPSRLSNSNLTDAAITATDDIISVVKPDEVTDPAGLDSKDLFPVVIRLQPESVDVLLADPPYDSDFKIYGKRLYKTDTVKPYPADGLIDWTTDDDRADVLRTIDTWRSARTNQIPMLMHRPRTNTLGDWM